MYRLVASDILLKQDAASICTSANSRLSPSSTPYKTLQCSLFFDLLLIYSIIKQLGAFMKRALMSAILAATLTSGCSTIVSKSDYSVAINSQPEGAEFLITNQKGENIHQGMTPEKVTLKASSGYFKNETYHITLKKAGYAEHTYTLKSRIDGWYFGNILFGGLVGMLIIDPATGAMYNLPDRVDVPLNEKVSDQQPDRISIGTLGTLNPEQVARLERID